MGLRRIEKPFCEGGSSKIQQKGDFPGIEGEVSTNGLPLTKSEKKNIKIYNSTTRGRGTIYINNVVFSL